MRWIVATSVTIGFLSGISSAQSVSDGLPDLMFPDVVGVNTHFVAGHTKDLDMIAAAGFKFIRQDVSWAKTEAVRGKYNWSAYDSLMADVDQRGIRMLFTLNYNNPLYGEEDLHWGPQNAANIEAYAQWAGAAARHFADRHILWEIWNEPNTFTFWKPTPDANQYVALALATCKAIRAADPKARIVGPAMAGLTRNFAGDVARHDLGLRGRFNWDFVTSVLASEVVPYLEGFSVHCYRDNPPEPPETVGDQFKVLKEIMAKYLPPGKKIPIISGEWGYTTCVCNEGVFPQTQADWIARMQIFNLYSGIPLSIWYDWKDDGTDPAQKGQHRGLVTHDLRLKPSYVAMTTLTHQLEGYRMTRRLKTSSALDFVFVLTNSRGDVKVAAWTQGETHTVTFSPAKLSLAPSTKKIWCIDGNAEIRSIRVTANGFTAELDGTPKYLSAVSPAPVPHFEVPVPSTPELASPASMATETPRNAALSWNASASSFPIRYRVQVATDPAVVADGSFKDSNIVSESTVTDVTLHSPRPLDSGKTYYWHVRALVAGGQGDYSSVRSFKTGSH